MLHKVFCLDLSECCKNTRVNLAARRVSLDLVQDSSKVREVLIDEFGDDFLISLHPFGVQDIVKSFEERSSECGFIFSFRGKLDHGATGMEWLNDFILIVAGEYESAISIERFDVCPEE